MKLPGDFARELRAVLEPHRRSSADNAQSPSFAKVIDNVIRHAERKLSSVQIGGKISKGENRERQRFAHRNWLACKMFLKETAHFLDGEDDDDSHNGIYDKTEIAGQIRLTAAVEIALAVLLQLFLDFLFLVIFPGLLLLNRGAPAGPPSINLRLISVNGIVFAVLVAIDWQTFTHFPSLGRANVSF